MATDALSDSRSRNGESAAPGMPDGAYRFPFLDDVKPGESGHGYVLRMASENFLAGLPVVKGWLGKSRFACLDEVDAPLLAAWFGADEQALGLALGRCETGHGNEEYSYAGCALGRSYFLNRTYPRVCVQCLADGQPCKLLWDFELVVACPQHECLLTDTCASCMKQISWSRPAIRVCSCGYFLEGVREKATAVELAVAKWAFQRLSEPDLNEVAAPKDQVTPILRMLKRTSLNGGFHVIHALGTAKRYTPDRNSSSTAKVRGSLKKARAVLRAADELSRQISTGQPIILKTPNPSALVRILADLVNSPGDYEDRQLAQFVMSRILSGRWAKTAQSALDDSLQRDLFDDL